MDDDMARIRHGQKHCSPEKVTPFLLLIFGRGYSFDMCSGESVSEHSAAAKRLSYTGERNAVAFKLDIRSVVDWKSKEYDVAAGELSKMFPNEEKLFRDEEKLMREGKDVVDGLVSVYNGKCAESDAVS
ncbi:hypothetical protein BJV82DRAFT_618754 [Fennellomyces sp. T-0311]|nr:hypothetical protein BJV82DRAFT_618754 [Fennellomyces sp. T-0311]